MNSKKKRSARPIFGLSAKKIKENKDPKDKAVKKANPKFPVTLAKHFEPVKQNIHDGTWAWSRKLDGCRAHWDVDSKQLLSRTNKPFSLPTYLHDVLCKIALPLDGEIFAGDGNFSQCMSIVRKKVPVETEWREHITFQVFDIIDTEHSFFERMGQVQKLIPFGNSVQILKQNHVQDDAFDLWETLKMIESQGGEGLMLRKIDIGYEHRRSPNLLKVKTFSDSEFTVLKILPGKGKHFGKMGAIVVQDSDGHTAKCGSGFTDQQRSWPPFKVGDTVTLKWFERTKADKKTGNISYRFPTFQKIKDVLEI